MVLTDLSTSAVAVFSTVSSAVALTGAGRLSPDRFPLRDEAANGAAADEDLTPLPASEHKEKPVGTARCSAGEGDGEPWPPATARETTVCRAKDEEAAMARKLVGSLALPNCELVVVETESFGGDADEERERVTISKVRTMGKTDPRPSDCGEALNRSRQRRISNDRLPFS